MKLTIDRNELAKGLAHIQSVVEKRNTIPVLSNVLLRADKNSLSLSATDMDLEIVEKLNAKVEKPGATTVPAHTFYDIVRKLPEGSEVELEFTGADGLSIRCGRSKFRLGCLPVEDFPQIGGGEALPKKFTLAGAELSNLIDRTKFAISTEETRFYLNGIYFHAAKAEGVPVLRAVATDGHRLARVEMPLPEGANDMPGVILPRKTVNEVRKLMDETDSPVEISLSDSKIRFALGNVILTSKLIDGTFPDYERVIPTGNDKILEINPKLFANAVDRVATISSEKSRAVKLNIDKGSLILSASSNDNGSAREELEVQYTATPIEVGFNARYLMDIAQQIEGDGCRFIMADAAMPAIVQDIADPTAVYVLMPMRV
jgi:DNA polymerase-3 subunit beta